MHKTEMVFEEPHFLETLRLHMYYPVTNTQKQNLYSQKYCTDISAKMVDGWTLGIQSAPDYLLMYSFNWSEKDFGRASQARL